MGRVRMAAAAAVLAAIAFGAAPGSASAATVWACKPGQSPDYCREGMATTIREPNGSERVVDPGIPANPPIDCFYVYPTVSNQVTDNATRSIDPEIKSIIRYQAARFSQQCKVYVPVYRQATVPALLTGRYAAARAIAYADVVDAWRDYLVNHNNGRGVVLIGHSQGTGILRRLIRAEIDKKPAVLSRLVSALLLGGNVLVKQGERANGDFTNIPACTSPHELGCVIAYSTFNEPPPEDTRFGRPPVAEDRLTGFPGGPGYEVLCTNPASLTTNSDRVFDSYIRGEPFALGFISVSITQLYGGFPPTASTPFLKPADRYHGRCERVNGAHVLMARPLGRSRHLRPSPDRTWGLHLLDVNGALGDLQRIVAEQSAAYRLLGAARVPAARITLRLRHRRGRDASGRRCARPPIRARLGGADRRGVRRVAFGLNRKAFKRDRRAPFAVKLGRKRLGSGRVVRIGLRATLADGRSARRSKRVRVCG